MPISERQRERRAKRIGSSDATRIMSGAWRELWLEKTGRSIPADLDLVPAVQIGIATEALHERFYRWRTGIACRAMGERSFLHPEYDFLVAHPDFLTWSDPALVDVRGEDTVLEAKFNSGFQSDEDLTERYYWQLVHQMLVTGFSCSVLSILRPSSYSFVRIDRNEESVAVLLETLKAFWWYVAQDVEPENVDPLPPPPVDGVRVLDMSAHNAFAFYGGILLQNRDSVVVSRDAETRVKGLMPDDARIAFLPAGHADDGLILTRCRDGRLSLRYGRLSAGYRGRLEAWRAGSAGGAGNDAAPDEDDGWTTASNSAEEEV